MLKPLAFAFAAVAALGTAQAGAASLDRPLDLPFDRSGATLQAPGAIQIAQGGGADIQHAFEERKKERARVRAERERQKRLEAERKAQEDARQEGQSGKQ